MKSPGVSIQRNMTSRLFSLRHRLMKSFSKSGVSFSLPPARLGDFFFIIKKLFFKGMMEPPCLEFVSYVFVCFNTWGFHKMQPIWQFHLALLKVKFHE